MMKILTMIILFLIPFTAQAVELMTLRHEVSLYKDAKDGGISMPEGVGCSDKSVLTVADTGHGRLQQYTMQDEVMVAGTEIKIPQIIYPQRIRVNTQGDIFVLDGRQHRIVHLKPTGEFVGYVEALGLPGPGPSWIPKSLAIDAKDNLYILDIASSRVLILSPEGKFQKQIEYPQVGGFFSDVAVDPQGTVFLLNSVTGSLYTAAPDAGVFSPLVSGLKSYVNFPTALAVDRKNIYLVDQNGGGVVVFGRDGSFQGNKLKMGWKEGELFYPADICIDGKGHVFIADRGNNRVQIFMREVESK